MKRKAVLWSLLGFHLVFVLFLAVWLFMAGISLMSFNDPSVFAQAFTWFVILYLLSYPAGLLAAVIAGWRLYSRQRYRAAILWNVFPALWIVSALGILMYANFS
ncbi:hypothetical protein [Paenibacillus sp. HJGM_3]|uniref:hypothetical protein n=1 Tax=Paenibacillus sp. HJGM_3 TaxID=3379816 RepID=UPI003859412F